MHDVFLTTVGLVILIAGAECLVRGASSIARLLGVPPLIVGLTIVAVGTSAPEFAVSVKSGLAGHGGIAAGNVLGSNIFNILFILGASALITPMAVAHRLVRAHVPIMILVSVLVWLLGRDGMLGRVESAFLLALFSVYMGGVVLFSRRADQSDAETGNSIPPAWSIRALVVSIIGIVLGLALLVWGARLLVTGASDIARRLGVNELTIGLTIVAAGTSLPEAAASLTASLRGERDIAVGNVVGSNIFNVLCALPAAGILSSGVLSLPENAVDFDMPVMLAASVVCLPVFVSGAVISRGEGGFFLGYYLLYLMLLVLRAAESDYVPLMTNALLFFLLPATAVVLGISLLRAHSQLRSLAAATTGDLTYVGGFAVRNARKIVVLVVGMTVLLVGVAMIVLPGPAIVVIPTGLAILGAEFLWARRLLQYMYSETQKAAKRLVGGNSSDD